MFHSIFSSLWQMMWSFKTEWIGKQGKLDFDVNFWPKFAIPNVFNSVYCIQLLPKVQHRLSKFNELQM